MTINIDNLKTEKCVRCNQELAFPSSILYNGEKVGPLCDSCLSSMKICRVCGKLERTFDGLCNSCKKVKNKPKSKCKECGNTFTSLESKDRCPDCSQKYFKCGICGLEHKQDVNFWNSTKAQLKYYDIFVETASGICYDCADKLDPGLANQVYDCTYCGKPTISYILDSVSGNRTPVCPHCSPKFKECSGCGDFSHNLTAINDENHCNKCLCDKFSYCDICGYYHKKSALVGKKFKEAGFDNISEGLVLERIICPSCVDRYVICVRCGCTSERRTCLEHNNKHYCEGCSQVVGVCSVCSKFTEYKTIYRGKTYCRKCTATELKSGVIQQYSFTPIPKFKGKGPLFLGFENETSFSDSESIQKGLVEVFSTFDEDDLIVKSDSSISQGFEIVSHPYSFDALKEQKWDGLFPTGCRKHSSCGMHIHMSKNAFTTFHLFKFINFINLNPNFIRTIAQRDENHYCANISTKLTKIAKEKYTSSRYLKVNLNKSKTVELRFFAHATSVFIFLKNIEFAQALWEFTKNTNAVDSKNLTKFIGYVKEHGKRFNNLLKFIFNKETK